MAYRGEDLDLRVPQDPASAAPDIGMSPPRGRSSSSSGRGSSPIWVDETLLDCCNHAYEVALHHRAAEVRIEHLVYAITRIEAAQDALEQRGIRIAALRRETLNIVASEIPVGPLNGKSTPRRSDALEEVLRLASSAAYRHKTAATVDHVVEVLLDYALELPGLQRLRALLGRTTTHIDTIPEPRPPEPPRERIRQAYYAPPEPRPHTAELSNLASAQQVYAQSSRLDVLEQSIRTLTNELSNERKVISGVLHDLQREIMAQRDETARLGGVSQDKIQGFLSDRLQGLEQTLFSARSSAVADIALIKETVATLERTIAAEMAQARAAIAELSRKAPAPVDLAAITNRLDIIEEAVLSREITDRVHALESALSAERDRATAADNYLGASLDSLVGAVQRQPGEINGLISNPMHERLNGLGLALDNLQAAANSTAATLGAALASTDQRVNSLQSSLYETQGAISSSQLTLADTQNAVLASQRTLSETQTTLFNTQRTVLDTQSALSSTQSALSEAHNTLLALTGTVDNHINRMTQVEELTAQEFNSVHETFNKLTAGLTTEFTSLQETLKTLTAHQKSIGSAIEHQSRETANAFGIVVKRIESLERATAKPVSMLEALAGTTERMHRLMVEKYFRRNRFWYWLFGTDDWLAASWPSQTARITKQLEQIHR